MIRNASFAELDANGNLLHEIPNESRERLPAMGLSDKEAEGIKQEQRQFKLEQSYAPNIVGIDQSGILRGIRSNDPTIKLQSEKLYTQLFRLQSDIAELTQSINRQAIVPLQLELTTQHAICRRLLNAVEAFPAKLGNAQNNQRQCQRDWHTAQVKLNHVNSNPPKASTFPTSGEIAQWEAKCQVAQQEFDAVDSRLTGWNETVSTLEQEAEQLNREFTEASQLYVSIQSQIQFLSGEPSSGKKTSVQRSECGL